MMPHDSQAAPQSTLEKILNSLENLNGTFTRSICDFDVIVQELIQKDKLSGRIFPGSSDFVAVQEEYLKPSRSVVFDYLNKKFVFSHYQDEEGKFVFAHDFFLVDQPKEAIDDRDIDIALLYNAALMRNRIQQKHATITGIIKEKQQGIIDQGMEEKTVSFIKALKYLAGEENIHCFLSAERGVFDLEPSALNFSKEFHEFETEITKIVNEIVRMDKTKRRIHHLVLLLESLAESHLKPLSEYLTFSTRYLKRPEIKSVSRFLKRWAGVDTIDSSITQFTAICQTLVGTLEHFRTVYQHAKTKELTIMTQFNNTGMEEFWLKSLREKMQSIVATIKSKSKFDSFRANVLGFPETKYLQLMDTMRRYENEKLRTVTALLDELKKQFLKLQSADKDSIDAITATIIECLDGRNLNDAVRHILEFMVILAMQGSSDLARQEFFMSMKRDLEQTLHYSNDLQILLHKIDLYRKQPIVQHKDAKAFRTDTKIFLDILQLTIKLSNELQLYSVMQQKVGQEAFVADGASAASGAQATLSAPPLLKQIHENQALQMSPPIHSSAESRMRDLLRTNPEGALVYSADPEIFYHAHELMPPRVQAEYELARKKLRLLQEVLTAVSTSRLRNYCSEQLMQSAA